MGFAMNQHPATVRRPATYQDVLDAPEHMVAELIEGALHLHPRPAPRHARASSSLGVRIGGPFDSGPDGPGGWWILDEPELHLRGDVLVPDLAGWRRERMPALPETAWFEHAPDWACEVLSTSTRAVDLTDKRRLYAGAGVGHLWFVDPHARTLEAFALRGGAWTLIAALKDDEEVRVPPFDAIAFPLSVLWPD
jgi:Uma2 family endonuclease